MQPAPRRDPEPPGAPVFQLLHGVVDVQRLGICWYREAGGAFVELLAEPWPLGGLGFGEAAVLAPGSFAEALEGVPSLLLVVLELQAGETPPACQRLLVDASQQSPSAGGFGGQGSAGHGGVDLATLGGAAGGAAGAEGGAAGAEGGAAEGGAAGADGSGPSGRRFRSLAKIAPELLTDGQSYLLVASGCLGAVEQAEPLSPFACGPSYTPRTGSLQPVLSALSRRVDFRNPAVQVLNAALGVPSVTLHTTPPPMSGKFRTTLAADVALGVTLPYPPLTSLPKEGYGVGEGYVLEVVASKSSATLEWGEALGPGALGGLEAGVAYTLVVLGAYPGLDEGWWHPSSVRVVRGSP